MKASDYKTEARGITVTLNWFELYQAASVGMMRRIKALQVGGSEAFGFDGDRAWTIDIEGAAGEMATAKALGLYWDGSINTFRVGGDVGDFQVRTMGKDNYGLLVRPSDKDDAVFVLVVGKAPIFRVVGWFRAGDAKREEWKESFNNGRPPAYFVPQQSLRPLSELSAKEDEYDGAVSKCLRHGIYRGDGNCPDCEREVIYAFSRDNG